MKLNEVMDNILEGPHDPNIFKAVFMLGAPGSGKSFIRKKLFTGTGLRTVDSDKILEYMLKKKNISMDLRYDNPESDRQQAARIFARDKTMKMLDNYIDGRLGLIIDGTGANYRAVNAMRKKLRDLGYDTIAIYIHVDEEQSQKRNATRKRSVDPSVVANRYKEVLRNIGAYEYIFGSNFYSIDNTTRENQIEDLERIEKEIRNWLKRPPYKQAARDWLNKDKNNES